MFHFAASQNIYPNWIFWSETIPSGNPGFIYNSSKVNCRVEAIDLTASAKNFGPRRRVARFLLGNIPKRREMYQIPTKFTNRL
jgi:hypothetical protein